MRAVPTLVLLVMLAAAPARAMNWSLGANMGVSFVSYPDLDDNVTSFSWPSQGLLNIFGTPGLRVGFTGENPQHEFFLDTGLSIISSDGTVSTVQLTGNYQYNFATGGPTGPYVTGGVGVASFNTDIFGDAGATSAVFGAGVGLRHRMGHGHGALRGEVRYDRMTEGEDDGFPVIFEANTVSLKLGFDLWGK